MLSNLSDHTDTGQKGASSPRLLRAGGLQRWASMKAALRLTICALTALSTLTHATVLRETFESAALGVQKAYRVYLPKGYESGIRSYPVIYLLHGWGVTENYWADNLGLAETADAMHLQAIIVMPDGDRSFYANSVTAIDFDACLNSIIRQNKQEQPEEFCVRRPMYEDYIIRNLIPHIDGKYRTLAKRESRAISGESAGGFGAMQLALRNKVVFSSVAVHSPFLSLLYEGPRPYVKGKVKNRLSIDSGKSNPAAMEAFGANIANWRSHDPASLVDDLKNGELDIYFDCGIQDEHGFQDEALYFHERLTKRGIAHRFDSIPGKHDDALWKERIKYSLQFHADHFQRFSVDHSRTENPRTDAQSIRVNALNAVRN